MPSFEYVVPPDHAYKCIRRVLVEIYGLHCHGVLGDVCHSSKTILFHRHQAAGRKHTRSRPPFHLHNTSPGLRQAKGARVRLHPAARDFAHHRRRHPLSRPPPHMHPNDPGHCACLRSVRLRVSAWSLILSYTHMPNFLIPFKGLIPS